MFSGNSILSSFQLVCGYSPSIVGIPKTIVTEELLQAHTEQVALRTLQLLLETHAPRTVRRDLFNADDPVWVYYRFYKPNEKACWVRATVVSAGDHFLTVRRSTRGPPMRVAYEDVPHAPRNPLTSELLSLTLEDELAPASPLADDMRTYRNPDRISSDDATRTTCHHTYSHCESCTRPLAISHLTCH